MRLGIFSVLTPHFSPQTVTSSTLSVLVPLLVRGLKERTTLDKRRTVVVIENMSKLVKDAVDAAPFIPQLLPGKPLEYHDACLHVSRMRGCEDRTHWAICPAVHTSTCYLVHLFPKVHCCIRLLDIEDLCTLSLHHSPRADPSS
jgi:hypothetical protein